MMNHEYREFYQRKIEGNISVSEDGCWIWQKCKHLNGYGRIAVEHHRVMLAHRVSYFAYNGDIPAGLDVCHKCDVRACVNPNHLFVGTRSENILDASRKNRISRSHQKKGSAHPSSKLIESDIPVIRSRLSAGEAKAKIAKSYGVSDRVILLIDRKEAWRHVQ